MLLSLTNSKYSMREKTTNLSEG